MRVDSLDLEGTLRSTTLTTAFGFVGGVTGRDSVYLVKTLLTLLVTGL
jgi:hypothetical protein